MLFRSGTESNDSCDMHFYGSSFITDQFGGLLAEADRETMFYPDEWPLPDPAMIWQFSEALAMAVVAHADAYPSTLQYFYMPQTGKLDALYNRLARKFERGEMGATFRCVTRPASDEGGFYGFERI